MEEEKNSHDQAREKKKKENENIHNTLMSTYCVCAESASLPNKLEHKIKNHVSLLVVVDDFSLSLFLSKNRACINTRNGKEMPTVVKY